MLGILSSTPVSVSLHAPVRFPACSNPCPQPLILFFLPRAVMSQEAPRHRRTPREPTVETCRILGVGHAGEQDGREPRRGDTEAARRSIRADGSRHGRVKTWQTTGEQTACQHMPRADESSAA